MSCSWDAQNQTYVLTETIIVSSSHGLVGRNGNKFNGDKLKPGDREIQIEMILPDGFFDPIKVEVKFPKELKVNKAVEGSVEEVSIPVFLANEDKASEVIIRETLTSAPRNFLAMLKRRVVKKLSTRKKKGTSEE